MVVVDQVGVFVIMQVLVGVCKYVGELFLCYLIEVVVELYLYILVVMYQDYGQLLVVCMVVICSGFMSVMMDGLFEVDGKMVVLYEYNVDVLCKVVEMVYLIGVMVEVEFGVFGLFEMMKGDKEDGYGVEGMMICEQLLIDLEQVVDFVKFMQCDVFVIVIGMLYGVYKFLKKLMGDILLIQCIKEIYVCILNMYFVMYGLLLVLQELLVEICEFGGDMKEIYGVLVEEIQEGIKYGVCKINIDIDLCFVIIGVICCYLFENLGKFDLCDYLKFVCEVVKKVCVDCYFVFGCEGQVGKIKLVLFDKIVEQYKLGVFVQVVC